MTQSSSSPETYACFVKMCIIYPLANKKKRIDHNSCWRWSLINVKCHFLGILEKKWKKMKNEKKNVFFSEKKMLFQEIILNNITTYDSI